MLENTDFHEDGGILTVTPVGSMDHQQDVWGFVEGFTKAAEAAGAKHILIDESQLIVTVDAVDVIEITNALKKQRHHHKGFRIAAINSTDLGISHIADLVAADRSMNYRHFKQKNEAIRWLLKEPHREAF